MSPQETNELYVFRRILVLGAVVFALGTALMGRLWYVQTVQVHSLSGAAAEQSVRRIRLSPTRGRIFDREGNLLVANRPSYDIVFHPSMMRQPGARQNTIDYALEKAREIGEVIGRRVDLAASEIDRHLRVRPPVPLPVFETLTKRELVLASEHLPAVRGVEIRVNYVRSYPYPETATHVLGFTGRRRPPDEFRNRKFSYVMPEPRGRAGIELVYDDELAGRAGMQMVRVDPSGYVYEQIGRVQEPNDGYDLILTLDVRAQQIAERLLEGKRGAFVVVDVRDGAVLAMASSPTYDLKTLNAASYGKLAKDEEGRPLVNRAVKGGYLPGSIVKPLIGLAALESGAVDPEAEVFCSGRYPIGNTSIGCWLRSGHGRVDMIEGIEQSCNSYFIDIGLKTGLDNIRPMFLKAGLGRAPELDLRGVGSGLVPSRSWALSHLGRNWIAIDTAFLSIGQGTVGVSPLQAALYAAAIGNGGTVYRPFLVRRFVDADGQVRKQTAPRPARNLAVREAHLEIIQEGMKRVVNGVNGSAKRARTPVIMLAGKTGTAEVKTPGDEHNNTWFIGYGPVENPRYAVCVLVEYGASGGRTAAPMAGEFFERWLGAQ